MNSKHFIIVVLSLLVALRAPAQEENPLANISNNPGLCSIIHHWGFIGDSLCSGEMEYTKPDGSTGYRDIYEYSWGARMCAIMGVEGEVYSHGGETARGWLNHYWDKVDNKRGLNAHGRMKQAYVIGLGVNDCNAKNRVKCPLGSFDTDVNLTDCYKNGDTFIGCYAGIIQRIQAEVPNAKFFVITMPRDGRDDYNDAIRHMADVFRNVYVIDLQKYAMDLYDKAARREYYLGGHLNAAGYEFTAWVFMTYIDWIIRHNMDEFRDIALVNTPFNADITAGNKDKAKENIVKQIQPCWFENSYLDNRVAAIPDGRSFIFLTDTHEERNNGNSLALPAYVKQKKSSVGAFVFGGDCMNWAETGKDARILVDNSAAAMENLFGKDFLWVIGNHDCNSHAMSKRIALSEEEAGVSDADIYAASVKRLEGNVFFDEECEKEMSSLGLSESDTREARCWSRMHYCHDDAAAGVRYIVLETGDMGYTVRHNIPVDKCLEYQRAFLKQCLDSAPAGYDIVVAGHQLGSRGCLIDDSRYEAAFGEVVDFRARTGRRVIMICGHNHVDDAFFVWKEKDGKVAWRECSSGETVPEKTVLLTWINCDANASYQRYAQPLPEKRIVSSKAYYPMTDGTVNAHSFDVVTFTKDAVSYTRMGAGEDRTFKYKSKK